jgi:hypothetical protein
MKRPITCDDCWFRQELLCALDLDAPCPTFRHASGGLAPPPQAPLVLRPHAAAPLATGAVPSAR